MFTAGVGENAAPIRARIADLCGWLGVRLDADANAAGEDRISGPDSVVQVRVIPTDEQAVIARSVAGLLTPSTGASRA